MGNGDDAAAWIMPWLWAPQGVITEGHYTMGACMIRTIAVINEWCNALALITPYNPTR